MTFTDFWAGEGYCHHLFIKFPGLADQAKRRFAIKINILKLRILLAKGILFSSTVIAMLTLPKPKPLNSPKPETLNKP